MMLLTNWKGVKKLDVRMTLNDRDAPGVRQKETNGCKMYREVPISKSNSPRCQKCVKFDV